MQLQTSIRSCEGNHYVVTVINDAAENSGLLSNNSCAQGAFEGRGPVAKETDEIQNGPRATVLLSFLFPLFLVAKQIFLSVCLKVFSRCFGSEFSSGSFWECFVILYEIVRALSWFSILCYLHVDVEHLTFDCLKLKKKSCFSWWLAFMKPNSRIKIAVIF